MRRFSIFLFALFLLTDVVSGQTGEGQIKKPIYDFFGISMGLGLNFDKDLKPPSSQDVYKSNWSSVQLGTLFQNKFFGVQGLFEFPASDPFVVSPRHIHYHVKVAFNALSIADTEVRDGLFIGPSFSFGQTTGLHDVNLDGKIIFNEPFKAFGFVVNYKLKLQGIRVFLDGYRMTYVDLSESNGIQEERHYGVFSFTAGIHVVPTQLFRSFRSKS
jgi:hypothetical protein